MPKEDTTASQDDATPKLESAELADSQAEGAPAKATPAPNEDGSKKAGSENVAASAGEPEQLTLSEEEPSDSGEKASNEDSDPGTKAATKKAKSRPASKKMAAKKVAAKKATKKQAAKKPEADTEEPEASDRADGAKKAEKPDNNEGEKAGDNVDGKESAAKGDEGDAGAEPKKDEPKKEEPKLPDPPAELDLNEFHNRPLADLYELAKEYGVRTGGGRSKYQLAFELLTNFSRRGTKITAEGLFELSKDGGFGFLRWTDLSFRPNADDVYVPVNLIRRHQIKPGNKLRTIIRAPRDKEKFLTADEVLEIEEVAAEEWEPPESFDKLTAMFPSERLILEDREEECISARVVDLISPLGKGQRGLIAAPPRGGKTILLKQIAGAISKNHPEVELLIVLLDERPEEVTDFEETIDAPVFASTFDESPMRHIQVADLVIERARRLVEQGRDVVILLDSMTRLARGYNNSGGKGGTMSGGVGSRALERPRKFFGSARNVEEGGSLTILATALIETESRMDEVIFEEFKGTGNMEIHLDRELVEKRIYPAIHTTQSGTRKDDLLYHPDELMRINVLRKQLAGLPVPEAMETLVQNINATKSNAELLLRGLRGLR